MVRVVTFSAVLLTAVTIVGAQTSTQQPTSNRPLNNNQPSSRRPIDLLSSPPLSRVR